MHSAESGLALKVLTAGALTTVQDAGRSGFAHLGVPPSGFVDVPAARLANRLVGNDPDAALLETTAHGPQLQLIGDPRPGIHGTVLVAVTGAPAPMDIDGRTVDQYRSNPLRLGQTLTVGAARSGVRSYIAVRGGIVVEPVLGSRSTDLLSGLGPAPLQPDRLLPLGVSQLPVPQVDAVAVAAIDTVVELVAFAGPSTRWFGPAALETLSSTLWSVSATSSRIGVRLNGPALPRHDVAELPPEGLVTGAIQVPHDGQPVLLLADHPVTGGYPVIAVARETDLRLAAQAAPGTHLRLRVR